MSYGVKYRLVHNAKTNQTSTEYRIDILQNGYSGSIIEIIGADNVFELDYEQIEPTKPLETALQSGRLNIKYLVRDASELQLLTDIFEADEKTYKIRLHRDGQLYWQGYALNDLLEYPTADYPFVSNIRAKDFTILDAENFPLSEGKTRIAELIAQMVEPLGFDYEIHSITNWTHSQLSSDDDILDKIYIDKRAIRNFNERGQTEEEDKADDTPISMGDALRILLKNFGLIMRQSGGKFDVYHISALNESTQKIFFYHSNGLLRSNAVQNLDTSIDRDTRYILPSSQNTFNSAIKKAKTVFDHRTRSQAITFPEKLDLAFNPLVGLQRFFGRTDFDVNPTSREMIVEFDDPQASNPFFEFNQFFVSDGKTKINLAFKYDGRYERMGTIFIGQYVPGSLPPSFRTNTAFVKVQIVAVSNDVTYYLQDADEDYEVKRWTTSPSVVSLSVAGSPQYKAYQQGDNNDTVAYQRSFGIQTDPLPTFDGTLKIRFFPASTERPDNFPARFVVDNFFTEFEFDVDNGSSSGNSLSIGFEAEQDGNFSFEYDHGTTIFGDGPTPSSPSALFYLNGSGQFEQTGASWGFKGGQTDFKFHHLLLKEIIGIQATTTQVLNAELYGAYEPSSILSYDGKRYFFIGGSLDGENVFSASFYQINFQDSSIDVQSILNGSTSKGIRGSTASNSYKSFWEGIKESAFFNTIFLANFVGELTQDIEPGLRTSLPVKLTAPIRIGEDYLVVDKANEKPIPINIVEDPAFTPSFTGEEQETYNTGQEITLHFDDQKFPALPAGSPIILSGGLVQSYFKVDPTKLLIQNERRDDSVVYGRVDSNIFTSIATTSIDVQNSLISADNPAVFTDGQKINLRRSDGQIQTIRVNGDQTFTSSPYTLNVQSFTSSFLVIAFSLNGSTNFHAVLDPVNQTSSIEFLKGRLILSADGSGGLAQIRLDGTGSSSSITLDADNINVIGQTTFQSGLFSEGFESTSGAQSKANTAQSNAESFAQQLVDGIDFTADELAIKDSMAQALGFADFTSIVASAVQNDTLIVGGYIDTSLINTDAIFANNLVISSSGSIQSSTYNQGVDGFKINADGSAEFNDIALRTGNYSVQTSGVEIDGNDLNVNGTVTVGNAEVTGSAGTIVIQNPEVGTRSTNAGGSGDDTAIKFTSTAFQPQMEARSSLSFFIAFKNVTSLNPSGDEYGGSIGFINAGSNTTIGVSGLGGANLTFDVNGTLTKNAGSFKIDHPLKPDTHHLVHSFTESPQADLIYRGKAFLNGGEATINIDEYVGMTSGTFEALCRNVQVFTSNETSWHRVRGRVEGANVIVECEDPDCTDEINWLVMAERQDEAIYNSSMTDENGKVILEPEKPQEQPQAE